MIAYQRVLIKKGANLIDKSIDLCDFYSQSVSVEYETGDAIFLASIFPFNHKYFEITTPAILQSSIFFQVWDGNAFRDVVDLIDITQTAGVSMAKSGLVRFTPDKDVSWVRTAESYEVPGLEGTDIYSRYWSKITFSHEVDFSLKFIGHRFSTDNQLYAFYPDLNNSQMKLQFETGKTTWDLQHFIAADLIINDLITRGHIFTKDQILSPESYTNASIHRVAAMVYAAFGAGFVESKNAAMIAYDAEMSKQFFMVDKNANGRLDLFEHATSSHILRR